MAQFICLLSKVAVVRPVPVSPHARVHPGGRGYIFRRACVPVPARLGGPSRGFSLDSQICASEQLGLSSGAGLDGRADFQFRTVLNG
jgi:hypothetical protein